MKKNEYLRGKKILPERMAPNTSVIDLVENRFFAFNAARLSEAARLFATKMLAPKPDVTVGLTMAGALTPAGLGGSVIALMEAGMVDWVIATGANYYHDLHYALDYSLHQGDFKLDDVKLREQGVIRIYDVLFDENVLLKTDAFVRECLYEIKDRGGISTAELHEHLGQRLLPLPGAKYSIVAQAARLGIPLYTSSPGDSSIGMNVARLGLEGHSIHIDPNLDVNETAAIVYHADQNGALILGGGSPKNFYMQTQPQLWEVLGINRGGHDYFIQITADAPHWGGLSGATAGEAVSWGKINPDELSQTVTCYADSTIAFPIIASYALGKAQPRAQKRLYDQRAQLVADMKVAFEAALVDHNAEPVPPH